MAHVTRKGETSSGYFGIYLPISGHWVTEEVINHIKFVLFYYYKALVLYIFPIGIRRPLNEE